MFVIVNKTSKLPEQFPDTSGLLTEAQTLQWIDDMVNNNGMGVNQELIASHEPDARPIIEEKYMSVQTNEAYFNEAHPVYTMLKQYRKTYSTEHKPVEEKLQAVEVVESEINETVIPTWKQLKTTILALDSLLDHLGLKDNATINATTLNNKKKKQLKVFKRAANKIRQNNDEKDNKKALLTANPLSNPSLTEGWAINDFTEDAV
jgi:hypothetical protein